MAVRTQNTALTVLKFVLAAIIAVALVKIAFFPSGTGTDNVAATPGSDFSDPVIQPTVGDLTASVTLDASVTQDAASRAQAEMAGTVERVHVADGDQVAAGAVLARLRQETPVDPRQVTDADGNVSFVEQPPRVTTRDVTAPVGGTVDIQVLKDQMVAVGDVVAVVQPASSSVVATLTPEQRYRLVNAPADATVELRNGPGTFTCTGVKISAGSPAADEPSMGAPGAGQGNGGSADTTARATCAVPAEVTVFPGLAGTMRLETGSVQGALLLPTTAVQGTFESGTVWVTDEAGGPGEATPVTLGLTDGKQIEVTGGIDGSTTVLEFAPVARAGEVEGGVETDTADPALGG